MRALVISLLFCFLFLGQGLAQNLDGKVYNREQQALVGATLHWLGTSLFTTTDENGVFQISKEQIQDFRLIIQYVGYQNDTLSIDSDQSYLNIELQPNNVLETVEVTDNRQGSYISSVNPIKTEVISEVELTRAACCDLAGCFGTEASVQANTTNIVTNAKELRILGLSGVYNQVLLDGMPMIQGLSYTYGISSVPGTLVKNIYVAKGANSVLQGYESMVGQINVILKEPDEAERFLFNAYVNSFLEKQFNTHATFSTGDWSSLLAVHTTQPANRIDQDDDNFLDLPLLTRYSIYNKWKKGNPNEWGFHSKIGWRFVRERRIGGQVDFDPKTDEGKATVYGQTVAFNQPELYTKTGYRWDDRNHLVLLASTFYQDQTAYFGLSRYEAQQHNAYFNLQHELTYKEGHTLKTGISYRYQRLEEDISFSETDQLDRSYAGNYLKKESIPGVFAENSSAWMDNKLVLITGLRLDHHQDFGAYLTPRALVKYQISESTTVRASVGSGWRTVNLFSENINLLASSRDLVFSETLQPERAINFGLNAIQKIIRPNFEAWLSLDLYRTQFSNQFFPDYDQSPTQAIIANFSETSVGNGLKAEVNFELWDQWNAKLAYNYLDVYRQIEGNKNGLQFIPKHKLIGAFSFQPRSKKWHLDWNIHWYGRQRLARTEGNPPEFRLPEYSKTYTVLNLQYTQVWKRLDLYLGCENVFNFRQERAILSWQDPFGPYFDTASVWGPTRGREFYLGWRYKL